MPDQQQHNMQNLRDVPPPNLGYVKSEEVAFGAGGEMPGTPMQVPEIERPPLRHIDKYIRPECPCLSKRYTVATLTCIGTQSIIFFSLLNLSKYVVEDCFGVQI